MIENPLKACERSVTKYRRIERKNIVVKQENGRRSNIGKNFKTFDQASRAYKNPQIKIELLKIELGL